MSIQFKCSNMLSKCNLVVNVESVSSCCLQSHTRHISALCWNLTDGKAQRRLHSVAWFLRSKCTKYCQTVTNMVPLRRLQLKPGLSWYRRHPKMYEMVSDGSSRAENWTVSRKISMCVFFALKESRKNATNMLTYWNIIKTYKQMEI